MPTIKCTRARSKVTRPRLQISSKFLISAPLRSRTRCRDSCMCLGMGLPLASARAMASSSTARSTRWRSATFMLTAFPLIVSTLTASGKSPVTTPCRSSKPSRMSTNSTKSPTLNALLCLSSSAFILSCLLSATSGGRKLDSNVTFKLFSGTRTCSGKPLPERSNATTASPPSRPITVPMRARCLPFRTFTRCPSSKCFWHARGSTITRPVFCARISMCGCTIIIPLSMIFRTVAVIPLSWPSNTNILSAFANTLSSGISPRSSSSPNNPPPTLVLA
mmetsp:Transcript_26395/g.66583  ORF Transcript_26395/g.66583 Transcript_26395/m.66583 type:complete len:277 (-) Transcript_26395:1671-2501(-)